VAVESSLNPITVVVAEIAARQELPASAPMVVAAYQALLASDPEAVAYRARAVPALRQGQAAWNLTAEHPVPRASAPMVVAACRALLASDPKAAAYRARAVLAPRQELAAWNLIEAPPASGPMTVAAYQALPVSDPTIVAHRALTAGPDPERPASSAARPDFLAMPADPDPD